MIRKFKVSGHSMEPYLKEGDQVLAFKFSEIKKGDIVVFRYESKTLIKRVKDIKKEKYFFEGDNKRDSLKIGEISKGDIIGKVIFKL